MRAHEREVSDLPAVSAASVATFIGTLAGVVLLIGALLVGDLFLARIDLRESSRHAESQYRQGMALLVANEPAAAVDRFAAATAIERDNLSYSLALGEAEQRSGHTKEAEATISALVDRAENDGAVNLAMARVLSREGRIGEAKAFFHRAIYGRWGADSLARRSEARFALIGVLAAQGGGRDLLAELLPLEDVPSDSVALRKRLGRWFLLAGSPVRAANMFREVLRRDPRDGDAFAGMAEAALAQGNFRTAKADFAAAASLGVDDSARTSRVALVDTLIAADPTARGLDASARLDRGRSLLVRMLAALAPCVQTARRPAATTAERLASVTVPARNREAAADSVLAAASELWSSYAGECPAGAADPILHLLAVRLSQ